jgi:hypothetical protein
MVKIAFILLAITFQSFAQKVPIAVTGRVVDEQRKPLFGATITVAGVGAATTSDAGGYFVLNNRSRKCVYRYFFCRLRF